MITPIVLSLFCEEFSGLKLQVFISYPQFLDYRELQIVYFIRVKVILCTFRQDIGQHVCLTVNI